MEAKISGSGNVTQATGRVEEKRRGVEKMAVKELRAAAGNRQGDGLAGKARDGWEKSPKVRKMLEGNRITWNGESRRIDGGGGDWEAGVWSHHAGNGRRRRRGEQLMTWWKGSRMVCRRVMKEGVWGVLRPGNGQGHWIFGAGVNRSER